MGKLVFKIYVYKHIINLVETACEKQLEEMRVFAEDYADELNSVLERIGCDEATDVMLDPLDIDVTPTEKVSLSISLLLYLYKNLTRSY